MPQQTLGVGSAPNDGTGDPLRDALIKANSNFTELYARAGALSGTSNPEGNVAADPGAIYIKTDGGADSTWWVKRSGTGNTGWEAFRSEQGLFTPTGTGTVTRTIQARLRESVSLLDFGAVPWAVDNNFDCTAAVQAAVNHCSTNRLGLFIPSGRWRMNGAAVIMPDMVDMFGDGMFSSIFWDTNGSGRTMFRNINGYGTKIGLSFRDLGFMGSAPTVGWQPMIFCDYYPIIRALNCRFYDIGGMAFNCEGAQRVHIEGCEFERVNKDQVRFRSSQDVTIVGNSFKASDDDSIALHQADYVIAPGKIRERITITSNVFEDTMGVSLAGGRFVTVTGNTFHRCKLKCIGIDGSGQESSSPRFAINVSNNLCLDTLYRLPTDGQPATRAQFVIKVNGLTPRAGSGDATIIPGRNDPDNGTITQPYAYREVDIDNAASPIPGTFGVTIANNVIMRTLPPVSEYDDWGFGTAWGVDAATVNEEMTEFKLRPVSGIDIGANIFGAVITGNYIANCVRGIQLVDNNNNQSCLIKISDNILTDITERGIFHAGSSVSDVHTRLYITDNVIDMDFFHVNTGRNTDGSWDNSTVCYGISLAGIRGVVIEGNIFSNCFAPFLEAFVNRWIVRNNICVAEVNTYNAWNAANKGIGVPPLPGPRFQYINIDADPDETTFNEVQDMTLTSESVWLTGSATFDPGNLADGAGETTTVTVTGAALGDFAQASFSLTTSGITITAWVSAANTVSVRFQNETGGALDIGSGTLRVRVTRAA